MAAPTPSGANFMTNPVNLNITSVKASQKCSIVCLGLPCTCANATAKTSAKKTTCKTSFSAAA